MYGTSPRAAAAAAATAVATAALGDVLISSSRGNRQRQRPSVCISWSGGKADQLYVHLGNWEGFYAEKPNLRRQSIFLVIYSFIANTT